MKARPAEGAVRRRISATMRFPTGAEVRRGRSWPCYSSRTGRPGPPPRNSARPMPFDLGTTMPDCPQDRLPPRRSNRSPWRSSFPRRLILTTTTGFYGFMTALGPSLVIIIALYPRRRHLQGDNCGLRGEGIGSCCEVLLKMCVFCSLFCSAAVSTINGLFIGVTERC